MRPRMENPSRVQRALWLAPSMTGSVTKGCYQHGFEAHGAIVQALVASVRMLHLLEDRALLAPRVLHSRSLNLRIKGSTRADAGHGA